MKKAATQRQQTIVYTESLTLPCTLLFLNPTLIAVDSCRCVIKGSVSSGLHEPPYTEPYVRWCGRTAEVTPPPTRFTCLFTRAQRSREIEMNELSGEIEKTELQTLPAQVSEELANYEKQIRKYRAGEVDETKMQKLRLHFGTYAQRQEGVQMQRIKIPGGFLTANQLASLADAAV